MRDTTLVSIWSDAVLFQMRPPNPERTVRLLALHRCTTSIDYLGVII